MKAAALVARLAEAGIDPSLLSDVAEALFTGEIEARSLAGRRKNERERKANQRIRSRDVTGQSVKSGDKLPPPKEEISNPPSSEPNGSGGSAADPVKEMFDAGVSILTASGHTEKQARSLIGKWRQAKGPGEVLIGLLECRDKAISNPVEWLEKRFKPARYVSKTGFEYRGSLDQIEREAQRRHDMDTYWQIQVDRKAEKPRRAANG